MIPYCNIELFSDGKMLTDYFELEPSKRAKLNLLGSHNETGVYETTQSELESITQNCELICLKRPQNVVSRYTLAYEKLLKYVSFKRILPYINGMGSGMELRYDIDETVLTEDDIIKPFVIKLNKNKKPSIGDYGINAITWNNIFLYSWVELHKNNKDMISYGMINYHYTTNVDYYGAINNGFLYKKYATLIMEIEDEAHENREALFDIFYENNGKILPLEFNPSPIKRTKDGGIYRYYFAIERSYISIDVLRSLSKHGLLWGGTALSGIMTKDLY